MQSFNSGPAPCCRQQVLPATEKAHPEHHQPGPDDSISSRYLEIPVVNASVITGFVRIANTESAEIPRSSSGSEYNGARWFVESLQPDAGAMQWVAWNGSEDWLQYAQRCKLEADTKGLVRGRHQLGYKVLPDKVENSDAKCGRYSSQQLGPKVDSRWHCDQQRDRRKLPISQLGSSPQRHSSTIKQRLQRQLRAFLAAVLKKDRDR